LKTFRHYSVVVILLSLVLFYSFPVKSLHACNNLIHHHDYVAFDSDHEDCLICDFKFSPADLVNVQTPASSPLVFSQDTEAKTTEWNKFPVNTDYNKGPPSIL